MCILKISPLGFFGLSKCFVPTSGLTFDYPTCSVCVCVRMYCVCVYTHTHTHTHTRTPVKNREITDTTPIYSIHLSKITTHAKIGALYWLAEPSHWVLPSSSNNHEHTVHTRAHVHALLRLCWQIWTMVSTDTCYSVHTCACTGAQETYLAQATPTIMHTHPRMHAHTDGATTSLPWTISNDLESWKLCAVLQQTKNIELQHDAAL